MRQPPTPLRRASIETTVLTTALITMLASPAAAEDWRGTSTDSGALIRGIAHTTAGTLSISCTAPSPGGRALTETGDHEALRTEAPYGVAFAVSPSLIDPQGTDFTIAAPALELDGARFPLPPLTYEDFFGAWTGITHIDAPGMLELFQTTTLTLDAGDKGRFETSIAGLSAALDTALGPCMDRWFTLGNPLPPRMAVYVQTGQAPGQPTPTPVPRAEQPSGEGLPAGLTPAPLFEIPDVAPQAAFDHVFAQCDGPFEITSPDAIQATDIDGDGEADYILNYSGVSCAGQQMNMFCGAANCAIDVFLSSRNHANPEQFLGLDLTPVRDAGGRTGLLMSATVSVCGETGLCPPTFWTGAGFGD